MRSQGKKHHLALSIAFFVLSMVWTMLAPERFQNRSLGERFLLQSVVAVPLFWLAAHCLKMYFAGGRPTRQP